MNGLTIQDIRGNVQRAYAARGATQDVETELRRMRLYDFCMQRDKNGDVALVVKPTKAAEFYWIPLGKS